jgi:tetratricopeptide (TPR) repeat protein
VCNNLAISLRDQDRTDEAIGSHQKAIEAFEAALGGTPDSGEVRLQCLIAHGAAAVTRAAAGRHSEAARDWDRVVDLADEPQRDGFRLHRAISQTLAGEHEKAADEVEKMLAEGERSDDERYNAACLFARAAGAARTDGRLADGERLSRAGVYSRRALGILDELRRVGYFLAPEKAAQLRADADFDPLHTLPEFQELLSRVDSPAATE